VRDTVWAQNAQSWPPVAQNTASIPLLFDHKGVEISKKTLKKNKKIPIALQFGHKRGVEISKTH